MNPEETIITIISAFLALSELLPFMKQTNGNGLVHSLVNICKVTLKALKEENNNVQKS